MVVPHGWHHSDTSLAPLHPVPSVLLGDGTTEQQDTKQGRAELSAPDTATGTGVWQPFGLSEAAVRVYPKRTWHDRVVPGARTAPQSVLQGRGPHSKLGTRAAEGSAHRAVPTGPLAPSWELLLGGC